MTTPRPTTRRHVLRLFAGAALAAVPAIALAGGASAGRAWCRTDPTVLVDGEVVHLYVSGLVDTKYDVSGPTQVVIRVPPGVATAVLEQDGGFGYGYAISFQADSKLKAGSKGIELAANVYVPATTTGNGLPIRVEWVPDGTVKVAASTEKPTNQWIGLATKIKRNGA